MLTLLIFILGVVTVFLSVAVAIKFYTYTRRLRAGSRKLSKAISWQLVGEAIIGLGTLVFSFAAHYGMLEHWSVEFQSAIRFLMFFATSATTYHLMKTLVYLEDR